MGSESQLAFLYFWDVSRAPPAPPGGKTSAQSGISGSHMDAISELGAHKESARDLDGSVTKEGLLQLPG